MNNKSQAQSIVIFFVLMLVILVTSIIVLRLTNSIITPFKNQIGNVSEQAGASVSYAQERFTSWWDIFIVLLLLINVLILFISAFLIDIHPAFLIIYIFTVLFLFIFGNYGLYLVDSIWGMIGTSTETAQTPLQQFIINNFQMIMLGIVILSGIIMYAKFKLFAGQGTGGNY